MALDLKAIHEALADQLSASPLADVFNVAAFPGSEKLPPLIEVVPGNQNGDYVGYFGSFGPAGVSDVMVTLRISLVGLNGEVRALWAWRLLSAGDNVNGDPQSLSIADVMLADKTLGGTVETCRLLTARWDDENDEVTIPVDLVARKVGAQV